MENEKMIKAVAKGIGAALLAWLFYGVFTSFFDDTILEQMFESSGILFAIFAAVFGVGWFVRNEKKAETAKESGV